MDEKTGTVAELGGIVFGICVLVVIMADGWWRWAAGFIAVLALLLLAFVGVTKRGAKAIINRFAPPREVGDVPERFSNAVEEADLPTGSASFMRLIWRLRKDVGPEIQRLVQVVEGLEESG